jgi:AraC-like DNA-binding protein
MASQPGHPVTKRVTPVVDHCGGILKARTKCTDKPIASASNNTISFYNHWIPVMVQEPLFFDLTHLPEPDRFPFWRDIGSKIYRPLPAECTPMPPLAVQAHIHSMGSVTLTHMEATAQSYDRTPAMLRTDGCDNFLLVLMEQGTVIHTTGERELTVDAGDLLLLDLSEVGLNRWTRHSQLFASLPRQMLQLKGAAPLQTTRLPRQLPHARLLADHIRSLWQLVTDETGLEDEDIARGLAALAGSYFRPADVTETMELLAATNDEPLLRSIQRWIDTHLHCAELGTQELSARFHVSRSSLYRLFEPWGGVRSYIRERRLQVALQVLRSRNGSSQFSLNQLANSLGFPSSSAFSHAFRRRWGVPPRRAQDDPWFPANLLGSEKEALREGQGQGQAWQRLAQLCTRYYRGLTAQS